MDKFEVMIKVGSLGAWGDLGGYNCKECQCQSVGELLTWTTDNWQTALDQSKRKEESFIVFVKDALGFCWGVILPTLAFKSSWLICSETHRRCNDCGKK